MIRLDQCPRCDHPTTVHREMDTGWRCQAPVTSKRNSRISPTNTCRCKRRPGVPSVMGEPAVSAPDLGSGAPSRDDPTDRLAADKDFYGHSTDHELTLTTYRARWSAPGSPIDIIRPLGFASLMVMAQGFAQSGFVDPVSPFVRIGG